MTNHLAAELRQILDVFDGSKAVYQQLLRLTEDVERVGDQPVEVDASTELTASFGLEPEQQSRSAAALAIGWQHPSDTDPPDYHDWWWTELGRLAAYIRTGQRPDVTPATGCTCPQIDVTPYPSVEREYVPGRPDPACPEHGQRPA